jgi:hypothetical protein
VQSLLTLTLPSSSPVCPLLTLVTRSIQLTFGMLMTLIMSSLSLHQGKLFVQLPLIRFSARFGSSPSLLLLTFPPQSFFGALTSQLCEKLIGGQDTQTLFQCSIPRPFYGRKYVDLWRACVSRSVSYSLPPPPPDLHLILFSCFPLVYTEVHCQRMVQSCRMCSPIHRWIP